LQPTDDRAHSSKTEEDKQQQGLKEARTGILQRRSVGRRRRRRWTRER